MTYQKPRLVISTVGIGLVTGGLKDDRREIINRNTNISKNQVLPDDVRIALEAGKMLTSSMLQTHKYSVAAELSSLAAIFEWHNEQIPTIRAGDEIHLITTDTHVGHACFDAIQGYFADHDIAVQRITCKGLQTADAAELQVALAELTKQLSELIELYRDSHEVICNVTGGFKAISGYIQQIATLLGVNSCYLFEQSRSLIYIPRMPITLDIQLFSDNPQYFATMRQIALGIEVSDSRCVEALYDQARIFFLDKAIMQGYTLSAWGVVVWQEIRQRLYDKQLFDPPTAMIVFADEKQLKKNLEKLNPKRYADINESIDVLANWLLHGTQPVKSHTIKEIHSVVAQYEMYAWNDSPTGRLFFNKRPDGCVEVLARLEHL